MEEVASGVWRLGTSYVNFYLLLDGDSITLVDTGFPSYAGMVDQALASLGRRPSDIEAILLTHAHADHCGAAAPIVESSGAVVYVHSDDVAMATGQESQQIGPIARRAWRPFLAKYMLHALRSGATGVKPCGPVRVIRADEVLDVPGRPRVIHTPGHSAGSCAYIVEDRAVLFCGDAFSTIDALTGRAMPAVGPHGLNRDDRSTLTSLDRLEGLPADIMLPGHGAAVHGDLDGAIAQARAHGVN
jgi:glyoxylase-like metal-dependent hydrolase (beta-lactamase superfamily II)